MKRLIGWGVTWVTSVAVILWFFRNSTRNKMPSPVDDMRGY